jgi:polysaccharide deacetylase family protein (PEP-CTERM system associated)
MPTAGCGAARMVALVKNALSIDLEDWYHPELVKRYAPADPEGQVENATGEILALLARHEVRATFFIVGDVARKHPELVKTIFRQGHEIACHGMTHTPLWDLSVEEFEAELEAFQVLIADLLGGIKIHGFRAPTFSLDHRTPNALKTLVRRDFSYDTSIFPFETDIYGMKDAPCFLYRPNLDNPALIDAASQLVEFPMSVFQMGRIRIPVSGGFYLRVIPYWLLKILLKRINKTRPFIIYLHPWETHIMTPRIKGIGLKNRFITYYGTRSALNKFERLLGDFEFESVIDVIRREAP